MLLSADSAVVANGQTQSSHRRPTYLQTERERARQREVKQEHMRLVVVVAVGALLVVALAAAADVVGAVKII